jgi:hypothetical protein
MRNYIAEIMAPFCFLSSLHFAKWVPPLPRLSSPGFHIGEEDLNYYR